MNGIIDIYSIIFLALAVVIFLRLRNVLGRRTGNERPPLDPYARRDGPAANQDDNIIGLPQRGPSADLPQGQADVDVTSRIGTAASEGTPLHTALSDIATADPDFDAKEFVTGGRAAYEMIVTAFAEGDRKMLRSLLNREVYDGFVGAIEQREQRGETIEFRFVGIDQADLTDAELKGSNAHVTVRFLSKLVSATRDQNGEVVDGDPIHVSDVTDIWTFARDLGSRDPNWKLVATESVE
ncbi:MAG: Tim44/TimA family putative adaptor protein [Alphaproteobacteria bacterium]